MPESVEAIKEVEVLNHLVAFRSHIRTAADAIYHALSFKDFNAAELQRVLTGARQGGGMMHSIMSVALNRKLFERANHKGRLRYRATNLAGRFAVAHNTISERLLVNVTGLAPDELNNLALRGFARHRGLLLPEDEPASARIIGDQLNPKLPWFVVTHRALRSQAASMDCGRLVAASHARLVKAHSNATHGQGVNDETLGEQN